MLMRLFVSVCIVLFYTTQASDLSTLLQKTAGVYVDRTKSVGDLKQTVLVTGCNSGFINQLLNFKCFAERLGMKFLVIAMDEDAHEYISKNTTMTSYLMKGGASKSQKFRSAEFNVITATKKEAVHNILELGYNVLFSDTDVAMIRDPVPYMMWQNVEYVHSLNYMCTM